MNTLTLHLPPSLKLTDETFEQLVTANRDWKFETTSQGELVIVPPTVGNTGRRNSSITRQLDTWSISNNLGVAFDSSTLFVLPNGARRSPDASWVTLERWNALAPQQQDKYPPLCPDFVVELRSPTDSLEELEDNMKEYLDNGASLGWLIDPKTKQVEIYRQGQDVEVLQSPTTLAGEDVLPMFILDLQPIFI